MKTKLGVGTAVLAIGLGIGLWSWHHAKKAHKPAVNVVETSTDPETSPKTSPDAAVALRTDPPAPAHTEASPVAPPPDPSVLTPTPPPSVSSDDSGARSFHPRPVPVAPADERPSIAMTDAPPKAHDDSVVQPSEVHTVPLPTPAMPDVASLSEPTRDSTPAPVVKSSMATSQPAVSSNKMTVHVMATGETYSSLAEKYLGGSKYASLIAKANPGKDPRKLFVGSKINIPPAPKEVAAKTPTQEPTAILTKGVRTPAVSSAAPVPPEHAYKVQPGETWHDLSRRFLGDSKRWTELYELNKERAPRNPDGLKAGTVIELPEGVKASSRPS